METRPLGQTGHESSILTFGALVLNWLTQDGANRAVELVLSQGVNHIDVAPTYGDAEKKLAPKLQEYRDDVFLGCKTTERTYTGAKRELEQSLERMGIDRIDLYQFHGLEREEELDAITSSDGALKAFTEAKDDGIIDHIGLTSHGYPELILDAIDRIDALETVMFPLNYTVLGTDDNGSGYQEVLDRVQREGMGALGIKAFAKQPWPPKETLPQNNRPYATWYQPFDTQRELDDCFNFAISRGMTSVTNPGDPKLLPMIINAAGQYTELSEREQNALIEQADSRESPVPARLSE